jgi:hypothetical protein
MHPTVIQSRPGVIHLRVAVWHIHCFLTSIVWWAQYEEKCIIWHASSQRYSPGLGEKRKRIRRPKARQASTVAWKHLYLCVKCMEDRQTDGRLWQSYKLSTFVEANIKLTHALTRFSPIFMDFRILTTCLYFFVSLTVGNIVVLNLVLLLWETASGIPIYFVNILYLKSIYDPLVSRAP